MISYGEKRDLFLSDGLSADLGRLCHRAGKCVAVPLYHRTVWRRGLCAHLSAVPGDLRAACDGHGAGRGPGEPAEHRPLLPRAGAQGKQVALVLLVWHRGQLSADDVLHRHRRVAAAVLPENGQGRFCGPGCRRGGRTVRSAHGRAGDHDPVYGPCGAHRHGRVPPGSAKRRGAHHQGDDALSAGHHGRAGRALPHPGGGCRGPEVLSSAQL